MMQLNLAGCRRVSDEGIGYLTRGCTLITSLNLASCQNVTDEGFHDIARSYISKIIRVSC